MPNSIEPGRAVRWGILGAGGIAATVGADIAATPGNEVVAVGSRDAARAAAFAGTLQIPRSYGSYADLVDDDDLDVIYVATTHGQHHEHALLALGAGKPVLVEKAFTLNARQARDVVAEARRRRRAARPRRLPGRVRLAVPRPARHRAGHRLALADQDRRHRRDAMGLLRRRVRATVMHRRRAEPADGVVTGTAGWISTEGWIARPTSITVHDEDGDQVLPEPPLAGNGYQPEIVEVERCLRAGELESPEVPLDDTVAILYVLDEVRAQVGVTYPADRD